MKKNNLPLGIFFGEGAIDLPLPVACPFHTVPKSIFQKIQDE